MYSVNAYVMQTIRSPGIQLGSCGFVLECVDSRKIVVTKEDYFVEQGTANKLELLATLRALEELRPTQVKIYLDVEHVASCINNGWLEDWSRNCWCGKNGKEVKNKYLWQLLYEQMSRMPVHVVYSMGHLYSDRMWNKMKERLNEYV